MTDSNEEALKDLFSWDNRNVVLRIRFVDAEEFEMTVSGWAQDIGASPHVHGTVIRPLKSKRNWKEGDEIMFRLWDVQGVVDPTTEEVIFKAE